MPTKYVPALKVGLKIGDPTENSVVFVVMSLSQSNITINVDGTDTVIDNMSAYGVDHGVETEAFFGSYARVPLTRGFREYNFTIEQDGVVAPGSIYPKPGIRDAFSFTVGTCEFGYATDVANTGKADDYMYSNVYEELTAESSEIPLITQFFIDDIMYVDTAQVLSSGIAERVSTGKPKDTLKEFDFGLAYACNAGIYPGDSNDDFGDDAFANYGRRLERVFTDYNMQKIYQFGNHEFLGVEGTFQIDVSAQLNGAFHKTALGFDGPGLTAYNKIYKPTQPTSLNIKVNDVACNLWAIDMGIVRVIALDNITNATLNTAFGNGQIDDVLAAIADGSQKFTVILSQHPCRDTDSITGTTGFDKTPLYENAQAEYERLVTNVNALMSLNNVNGAIGGLVWVFGDTHRGSVRLMHGTQGNVPENFLQVAVASMNRDASHGAGNGEACVTGGTYAEQTFLYRQPGIGYKSSFALDSDNEGRGIPHMAMFDVLPDENSLVIKLINRNGGDEVEPGKGFEVVYKEKLVFGRGNIPVQLDTVHANSIEPFNESEVF